MKIEIATKIKETIVFAQLPAIYSIPGTGQWGWHNVRELRTCINGIISSQGGHPIRKVPLEMWSFRPEGLFTWITRDTIGTMVSLILHEGDIDGCTMSPYPQTQVFVPAGWGIGVAMTVKQFGVVSICCPHKPHHAIWGVRWNSERYNLQRKEQFWLK